jgi:hypothetical protein
MGYICFSDFLSTNKNSEEALNDYVRKKQCLFMRANPIIILALEKMTLNLKGVVSGDGSFKVAGIQSAEAGFKMAVGKEQNISWTVTPVSLASLPDVYWESELKSLCDLKISTELKMDSTAIAKLIEEKQKNRDRIKEKIDKLQNDFNVSICK